MKKTYEKPVLARAGALPLVTASDTTDENGSGYYPTRCSYGVCATLG
jgi:hypothetical protein